MSVEARNLEVKRVNPPRELKKDGRTFGKIQELNCLDHEGGRAVSAQIDDESKFGSVHAGDFISGEIKRARMFGPTLQLTADWVVTKKK